MKFLKTAILLTFLISGCTWVKTTPGGDHVRMVSGAEKISGCKEIGITTVSLLDKVGFYRRDPKKVENELSVLGRNSAADMGGDTILPLSEVEDGQRTFSVYLCNSN